MLESPSFPTPFLAARPSSASLSPVISIPIVVRHAIRPLASVTPPLASLFSLFFPFRDNRRPSFPPSQRILRENCPAEPSPPAHLAPLPTGRLASPDNFLLPPLPIGRFIRCQTFDPSTPVRYCVSRLALSQQRALDPRTGAVLTLAFLPFIRRRLVRGGRLSERSPTDRCRTAWCLLFGKLKKPYTGGQVIWSTSGIFISWSD